MAYSGVDFLTKRNDTKPFEDRLEYLPPGNDPEDPDAPWTLVALGGATVRCFVSDPDTLQRIFTVTAVTILVPTGAYDPNVRYSPGATDMALAAYLADRFPLTLRAEWEVTYTSGIVETVPAGDDFRRWIVGLDHGP